jgi:hypothetical protein
MMMEASREIDREIQQQIDNQLNTQYESYMEEYFVREQQAQEASRNTAYPNTWVQGDSKVPSATDISASIQKAIDQYKKMNFFDT